MFRLYNVPLEIIKSLNLWFRRKLLFNQKLLEVYLFMGDMVIFNNTPFDYIMFH